MWFGYYPEIIFCHFFCNLNLVIFKCTIMAGDINSLNLLVWYEFPPSLFLGNSVLILAKYMSELIVYMYGLLP